jgi:hypothetical protein
VYLVGAAQVGGGVCVSGPACLRVLGLCRSDAAVAASRRTISVLKTSCWWLQA